MWGCYTQVCTEVCMGAHVGRQNKTWALFLYYLLPYCLETGSLQNRKLTVPLGWPAREPSGSAYLDSQCWDYKHICPAFYTDVGDFSSGSCACKQE